MQWFGSYSRNLVSYMRSVGGGVGLDITQASFRQTDQSVSSFDDIYDILLGYQTS